MRQNIPNETIESLPLEILESIAKYLEGSSLVSFALSSPRLRDAVLRRKSRVVIKGGAARYFQNISSTVLSLQALDLANCLYSSATVESMILQCPHLEKLNVVNTNLNFDQILNIFEKLTKLADVACSLLKLPSKPRQRRRVLAAQLTLKELFLDCCASEDMLWYLTDFLNHCQRIEHVHLNFIGHPKPTKKKFLACFPHLSPARVLRWKTLQTVVGSFYMSSPEAHDDTIRSFLSLCKLGWQYRFFVRRELISLEWPRPNSFDILGVTEAGFSKKNTREIVTFDQARVMRVTTHVYRDMTVFERVIELDLWHTTIPSPGVNWKRLIEVLVNMRVLAIHICVLPLGKEFKKLNSRSSPQQSYLVDALEGSRVMKLHIAYVTDFQCARCLEAGRRYIIGELERVASLKHFTLTGVIPSPDLLKSVSHSKLKVIKLCLTESPKMINIPEMLTSCKQLTHFKIEAPDLPLHSQRLWHALGKRNTLEQICLASESRKKVKLKLVRSFLPKVMKNVEVFHLHAVEQKALYAEIERYVKTANKNAATGKIRLLDASCPSLSGAGERSDLNFRIPGRNLCSTATLVGRVKLPGWYT